MSTKRGSGDEKRGLEHTKNKDIVYQGAHQTYRSSTKQEQDRTETRDQDFHN